MDDLREKVERIDNIRSRISTVRAKREAAIDVYHAACKQFDQELTEIQFDCPHWLTRHMGDPAGGRDSCTQCEICGASV